MGTLDARAKSHATELQYSAAYRPSSTSPASKFVPTPDGALDPIAEEVNEMTGNRTHASSKPVPKTATGKASP